MSNFDVALKHVLKDEGWYVNDPDDPGEETYAGISRRYHGNWIGWAKIDLIKETRRINTNDELPELYDNVVIFYRQNYWDKIYGDCIDSQKLAEEMMDIAVHLSVKTAIMLLQEGLNIFNNNEKLWDDIAEDGILGEYTKEAIEMAGMNDKSRILVKYLNCEQGHKYKLSIQNRAINEKYANSWYSRT